MKIKLQDLTPEIYYNRSRDFQFLGRLFDVVLNSVKTNADMIYNAPLSDNSDPAWIDLMTMTLGFQSKHNYNVKQLTALCNTFTTIMKYKGSLKAIQLAGDALSNAEGLTEKFDCYLDENDQYNLIMTLPVGLDDTSLLRDLMNYVLPAGMTYKFIPNTASGTDAALTSGFNVSITDYKTKIDKDLSIIITNTTAQDKYVLVENYFSGVSQYSLPNNWKNYYTKSGSNYDLVETWPEDGWKKEKNYYYGYYKLKEGSTTEYEYDYKLTEAEPADWGKEWYKEYYTNSSGSYKKLEKMQKWSMGKFYINEVLEDIPKDTTGFTVNSSIIVPQLTKSKGEN